jgi:hypothetical protein
MVVTRSRLVALFVVAGGLMASCQAWNPAGPGPALDGTWTGAIADEAAGAGSASLTIRQVGAGLSGTWSATFADSARRYAGSVGGTLRGAQVSLYLSPGAALACAPGRTLSGTLAFTGRIAGRQLTGSYVVLTCVGATGGTLDLTRQD